MSIFRTPLSDNAMYVINTFIVGAVVLALAIGLPYTINHRPYHPDTRSTADKSLEKAVDQCQDRDGHYVAFVSKDAQGNAKLDDCRKVR